MKSEEAQIKGPRLEKPVRIADQVWPEGTVPVVTIRCITYNHGNFIRDAIEGFLMQETAFPVEIIIHDDASTDGTAEIVKEYADKHPQLFRTILQKENQYSSGNWPTVRNMLISMSRGEFIALCEGDDYWICKQKLQKQVDILDANPDISLVFHNAWGRHAGASHKDWLFINHLRPFKNRYTLSDLITLRWFIATATMLYKKKVKYLEDIAKFAMGGDLVVQLSSALEGDFYCIDEVYAVYRRHENSMANSLYSNAVDIYEKYKPNYLWTVYCMLSKVKMQDDETALWQRIEQTIFEIAQHRASKYSKEEVSEIIKYTEYVILKNKPDGDVFLEVNPKLLELIAINSQNVVLSLRKNNIKNNLSSGRYKKAAIEFIFAQKDSFISINEKTKITFIFVLWFLNGIFNGRKNS
jgi:glycosyltransferase involved in cell wall biosynthesis